MKRRIYIGNFQKHLDKKKNHRVVFKKGQTGLYQGGHQSQVNGRIGDPLFQIGLRHRPKSTRPFPKRTRAFSEV